MPVTLREKNRAAYLRNQGKKLDVTRRPLQTVAVLRRAMILLIVIAVVAAAASPASARPLWKRKIDRLTRGRAISLMIADEGRNLYRRAASTLRVPASNEKLLLSMALFDRLGPDRTLATTVSGPLPLEGVVLGDVWISGEGDPSVSAGRSYARWLTFDATSIAAIARAIKDAGITYIDGSIKGSKAYFDRDWFAPGWKSYFPDVYVPLPTALTLNGNVRRGEHIKSPERRAARALTRRLRAMGVEVTGAPGAGHPSQEQSPLVVTQSQPLQALTRHMNHFSSNFFAEVLNKRLGAEVKGAPGRIDKGAQAIEEWALERGVQVEANDGSGLSYANRVSPEGVVRLLGEAEDEPWGRALRGTLPRGGEGTLRERLDGVRVRAKTGTLSEISALSGWVKLKRTKQWAEFSILSEGMSKSTAIAIEDRVVRIVRRNAR